MNRTEPKYPYQINPRLKATKFQTIQLDEYRVIMMDCSKAYTLMTEEDVRRELEIHQTTRFPPMNRPDDTSISPGVDYQAILEDLNNEQNSETITLRPVPVSPTCSPTRKQLRLTDFESH